MKIFLFIVAIFVFSAESYSQEKQFATIQTYDVDVKNARDMRIEPIKENERRAFDEFCKKITNPFLRIAKASVGETRRMIVYVKKLPKEVDYDAVSYYMMICALSTGLKISCCTIVDADTVKEENANSIKAEILGSSFWNSWEIKK